MLNNTISKVFGRLNENIFLNKSISSSIIKNQSIYSFSSFKYFHKANAFKFSSNNIHSGKTTIELIKILRAETSKIY